MLGTEYAPPCGEYGGHLHRREVVVLLVVQDGGKVVAGSEGGGVVFAEGVAFDVEDACQVV
ncbi:hypothetical protein OG949_13165 [Streptomyces scopuliridis]|nr:hypothetical protein [Streptomyces scopuliridis]WSB33726.1 hypothetical protein OG949_13165 [Streptomyces scopuliridis]